MSERFKDLVLKTSEHASVPWVRTPLSPSIRVHECCSTAGGLFFCAEKLMYGFGIKTTGGRHLSDDGVRITGYNTVRARVYSLLLSDLRVSLVKITKKELTNHSPYDTMGTNRAMPFSIHTAVRGESGIVPSHPFAADSARKEKRYVYLSNHL